MFSIFNDANFISDNSNSSFNLYNNDVLLTGIVTDDDNEKYVTIFCPTAPNPTSGFIYHVPREHVYEIDETVEDTMRTVLAGGFGSNA